MRYLFFISLIIALTSCGNSNKTVNSEDTETVNGYRYEKGSDEAFTGTVKFKNGTTKEYKDGKVISRTIYHENGQPLLLNIKTKMDAITRKSNMTSLAIRLMKNFMNKPYIVYRNNEIY